MKKKNFKVTLLPSDDPIHEGYSDSSQEDLSIDIQKNYVKAKLIPSLIELFDFLMIFLAEKEIQPFLVQKILNKRENDKALILYKQNIDNDKEEYSNLLYFTLLKQVSRFPSTVSLQISQSISSFYFQILKQGKLNVYYFYKKIDQKINSLIDDIIRSNNLYFYVTKSFIQSQKKCKLLKNQQKLSKLYGIMDIEDSIWQLYQKPSEKKYFDLLQNQEQRNQKILGDIIKYSIKIKRSMRLQKFRILSENYQTIKKHDSNNFRIKRTSSNNKVPMQIKKQNKEKSSLQIKQPRKLKNLKKICINIPSKNRKLKL